MEALVTMVLCLAGTTLALPQMGSGRTFSEPLKVIPGPEKYFTGIRVRPDTDQMVYHSEQLVAVVELGRNRALLNCELLEVKTNRDKMAALASLRHIQPQTKISFKHIMDLGHQCQKIPPLPLNQISTPITGQTAQPAYPILVGIVPGTKWCGRGDIASSYHDLGTDIEADKCCRTHDLCPVKVSGASTQYNITNYSMVTRSHCECDSEFHKCLKRTKTPVADVIGTLYFNVAGLQCVEDYQEGPKVRRRFANNSKRY